MKLKDAGENKKYILYVCLHMIYIYIYIYIYLHFVYLYFIYIHCIHVGSSLVSQCLYINMKI